MDQVWTRIEAWLAVNAPEVAAGLNPPASEEELAQTERFLAVEFPSDVRASFRRHNGQSGSSPWLLDGWEWLSLQRIRDEWKVWKELLDGGDFEGNESDGDGEIVRRDWWNAVWIPLTYSGSGDHHCLDLAPGPQGTAGQIIEMWHDSGERPMMAPSFRAWLTQFADRLEAGQYAISPEYGGLRLREDVEPAPPAPAEAMKPAKATPGERPLPEAFDAEREPNKLLGRAKAKIARNFRWTKAACLYDAVHLAHLLHVFGQDDEALEICRALGEYQFTGSYNLWSAVELALALQSRILRQRGEAAEAAECVRRLREAGFAPARLEGILLDRHGAIGTAMKDGDKKREQSLRLILAEELALIIELGGSAVCPVDQMEQRWTENRERLRVLTGAAG